VPLAFKASRPRSGVSCALALVFIFLCFGLMAIFVVLRFSQISSLMVSILLFHSRGAVFLHVQTTLYKMLSQQFNF
jgi:hypothetical protein